MTIAWYGHLKFKAVPLVTVVIVSWGIAFVEYCFAVPVNRIGSAAYELDAGSGLRSDRARRAADVSGQPLNDLVQAWRR